jgi:hypothetical protein
MTTSHPSPSPTAAGSVLDGDPRTPQNLQNLQNLIRRPVL